MTKPSAKKPVRAATPPAVSSDALLSPSAGYEGQQVELTPEARAVAQKEARDAKFAFATLEQMLQDSPSMPKATAHSILYVAEAYMATLARVLDVEIESAQARAQRYAALKAANLEITNLRRQVGQAVSVDSIRPVVEVLCRKVRAWWADQGFGHVSEVSLHESVMQVKLSCYLMTPYGIRKTTEQWHQSLRDQGFELVRPRGDDVSVLANNHNQEVLERLVLTAFPSARFHTLQTHYAGSGSPDQPRHLVMRELELYLPNLAEVAALPELEPVR